MVDTEAKWDRLYQDAAPGKPAEVLIENAHLLPTGGRALELACGLGANSLWLAGHGLAVDAWDISSVALNTLEHNAAASGLPVTTRRIDITPASIPTNCYDLVLVTRYLDRSIAPGITSALKPNGILCYQTFTIEKVAGEGPANKHYLLQGNELLSLFASLHVLAFRDEGVVGDTDRGLRSQSYLIAQKR